MTRFWENRKSINLQNTRLVYYSENGIQQALAIDVAGEIIFHIIEESTDDNSIERMLQETTCINAGRMLISNPFMFIPEAFENTQFAGVEGDQTMTTLIEKGMCLRMANMPKEKSFHAIVPLYFIAKTEAEKNSNLVYTCSLNGYSLVLFFRNGKCEFANVFETKNEAEIMYFAVAPIKKAGLNVDQVRFEFLSDAADARNILKAADRFLPNAGIARIELPYPAGEYPPHAVVSFLLYKYLQCELPEVS
jgi:Protein of unknown function (DUF3822)